jgi:catecholate siderophore receptor
MFSLGSNVLEWLYSSFHERIKYRFNPFKRYISFVSIALICPGLVATILPSETFAQSLEVNDAKERMYNISAGTLADALSQFSAQSGVNINIDPELTEGIMSFGMQGNYDFQTGLNQLLSESGLQAVPQGDGYAIRTLTTPVASEENVTTLPSIQVTATTSAARYATASSVTATKTNTLLRDTPQAISVITNELIKDQAIESMGDAMRYVPGVGVSQGEGNRDALIFRGNRSTGDFFIDGMRDDAQFFRDLYNIERIEVLKGANGMIFGRGGSGGVVNRVTKEAGWAPIREFSFLGGSFNRKRMTADIGQGIHDKVAFRLNAMYENADSFRGGVDMTRLGVSPTVTIKPTNRTKIVLNMERFHDRRTADRGIPSFNSDRFNPSSVGGPVNVGRSQFFGDPDRSNSNVDVLSFNAFFEHKFDIGVTVNNRTNYAQYDKFYDNVFANSAVFADRVSLGAYNNTTDRDNLFNQTNFLYSLDTGPVAHTLLAGVEIGRQETNNIRQTGFFNNSSRQTNLIVPFSDPITKAPITFVTRNQDADNRSVVDVLSLYIQDQIELLPQLQAIAGVRYDSFDVDFVKRNGDGSQIKTKDDLISPRFGLIYKPIEPVSFYASFSQAYVPRAGEQLTSIIVTRATLEPEKFTTYEAGIKWDVRPDLSFTGAVYRLDRTNVITVDPNDTSRAFLTDGQRTKGVELSLGGQLTPKWGVMGGYAYQDGEITSEQEDAKKGATVAELPRHTFSMWSRYDFTPRLGAAIGVINRSSMFASTDNRVKVDGFTRVDAAFYARLNKHVRAQVNIENLFDTNYIASVQNNNNLSPGSPTAVRASIVANF